MKPLARVTFLLAGGICLYAGYAIGTLVRPYLGV